MTNSIRYGLIFLFCCGLFIPGISQLPLIDRDAALFAQSSKQMIESQDIWHIKFQDEPRHRKPPGFYWLQVASYYLFSPFFSASVCFRLPSLFASLLCVLLLGFFTRCMTSARQGRIAAVTLAASLLFVIETHFADTNTTALLPIVMIFGALWVFYDYGKSKRMIPRSIPILLWLGVALGLVIKGVAPLFAIGPLAVLAYLDKQTDWWRNTGWQWGMPLTVLSVALWAVPLSIAAERNFIWDMLHQDFLPRLGQGIESHGHWPGYYLFFLYGLIWPFNLYVWPVLYSLKSKISSEYRFVIIWLLVNYTLIEVIPTKLFNYTLPLFPALSVLVSAVVIDFPRLPQPLQSLHRINTIVWCGLALLLTSTTWSLDYYFNQHFDVWGCVVFLISTIAIGMVCLLRPLSQWLVICCIALVTFAYLFAFSLPSIEDFWLSEKIKLSVERSVTLSAQQPLQIVSYDRPSLVYLLGTHHVKTLPLQDLNAISNQCEAKWYLLSRSELEQVKFPYASIQDIDGYILYRWNRLKYYLIQRK